MIINNNTTWLRKLRFTIVLHDDKIEQNHHITIQYNTMWVLVPPIHKTGPGGITIVIISV